MKRAIKWRALGVAWLLMFCTSIWAESPTAVLQRVATDMVSALKAHQSELQTNPRVIHRIVDETLVPVIDANRMAGLVVGRQYWYAATPDERREFVSLFKHLVINTYSNALASFNDDKVVIYPLRGEPQGRIVSVDSAVIRKNGQRIGINYQMVDTPQSWKVFDFSVEGVSIVSNYHSQFSNTLASGGMAQLVRDLKQRLAGSAS